MIEAPHILRTLCEIHQKRQELRVCQIMSIAAHMGGWENDDLFYCPDAVILKGLEIFRQKAVSDA